MRKLVFLVALCIASIAANAQQRFEPSVQSYYDFSIDNYDNKAFGIDLILGWRFCDYFKAGMGVGLGGADVLAYERTTPLMHYETWDNIVTLPLYANAKMNLFKEGISPFVSFDIGYTFSLDNSVDGLGLMLRPAVGVDIPVGDKSKIYVYVGYKSQQFQKRFYSNIVDADSYSKSTKTASQLEVALGYSF